MTKTFASLMPYTLLERLATTQHNLLFQSTCRKPFFLTSNSTAIIMINHISTVANHNEEDDAKKKHAATLLILLVEGVALLVFSCVYLFS